MIWTSDTQKERFRDELALMLIDHLMNHRRGVIDEHTHRLSVREIVELAGSSAVEYCGAYAKAVERGIRDVERSGVRDGDRRGAAEGDGPEEPASEGAVESAGSRE